MKTTWLLTSLFISSVSLAANTNATTMDSDTVDGSDANAVRYSSNSNDRYNNVDRRSNSMSSPSYYGAEENRLGEPENYSSRMTGSSSTDASRYDWESEAGNPTTDWESGRSRQMPNDTRRTTGGSSYDRPMDHSRAHMNRDMNTTGSATTTDTMTTTDHTTATDMNTNTHHMNTNRTTGGSSDNAMGAAATGTAAGVAAGSAANSGMTAQDTSRAQNETELVRKIRSEITSSSDLSMRAHNVKIISQNGQIYLKGPVATATEKSKVEEIAKRMAGNTNVVNQTYVEKK